MQSEGQSIPSAEIQPRVYELWDRNHEIEGFEIDFRLFAKRELRAKWRGEDPDATSGGEAASFTVPAQHGSLPVRHDPLCCKVGRIEEAHGVWVDPRKPLPQPRTPGSGPNRRLREDRQRSPDDRCPSSSSYPRTFARSAMSPVKVDDPDNSARDQALGL